MHVQRQIKIFSGNRQAFALPKGRKTRRVPLSSPVRDLLAAHLAERPARVVTLPWQNLDGKPVAVPLIATSREGKALNRNHVNGYLWKPALVKAGVIPEPKPGERFDPSREHGMHALRHYFASVLLDAGESIKALSEYLGHSDPGFTLRTYTHLMPASEDRTRLAIKAALDGSATSDISVTSDLGNRPLTQVKAV